MPFYSLIGSICYWFDKIWIVNISIHSFCPLNKRGDALLRYKTSEHFQTFNISFCVKQFINSKKKNVTLENNKKVIVTNIQVTGLNGFFNPKVELPPSQRLCSTQHHGSCNGKILFHLKGKPPCWIFWEWQIFFFYHDLFIKSLC